MRIVLTIIFVVVVATVGFGFYIRPENQALGELCIGLSVAGLFFIWMPLFIYHRWKDKKVKDYMLSKENIEKMKAYGKDKKL